MRSNAHHYSIVAPGTLDGVPFLDSCGTTHTHRWRYGTHGGPGRRSACAEAVSLACKNLCELRFIREENADTVRVGAGTTFTDIRSSSILAADFPLLAQTAGWTGSIANQNRGTLGGNIANASPAADTPPALLAYDAEIELISASGTRTLRYADFHLGYKRTALRPDETDFFAVRLSRRFGGHTHWVRKVGTRKRNRPISKIALAGVRQIGNRCACRGRPGRGKPA